MDRLTYRTDNGWVGVNNLEDKTVSPTSVAIHKLADIEDFMEENKFESLQHLKDEFEELKAGYDFIYEHGTDAINELKKENNLLRRIVDGVDKLKQYDVDVEDYILINPKTSYIDGISLDESMKLKQENTILKDRWQKLKEYVEQFKEYDPVEADLAWKIVEKMKELEGEKDAKN